MKIFSKLHSLVHDIRERTSARRRQLMMMMIPLFEQKNYTLPLQRRLRDHPADTASDGEELIS